MEVRVGPAVITIHIDDEVLVCEPNGWLSSNAQEGYFVADTRLVSGYRLKIGRREPVLLNSSQVASHSARFEFTNPQLLDDAWTEIPEHTLHLRLDRTLGRGLHEDYDVTNYSGRPIDLLVEISIESDFADLFDVKNRRLQSRGTIHSLWDAESTTLFNRFSHSGFSRGIGFVADAEGQAPTYANGGLLFPLKLEPGGTWHSCLRWSPILEDDEMLPTVAGCHDMFGDRDASPASRLASDMTRFMTSDPGVTAIIDQAVDDLMSLRMHSDVQPSIVDLDTASAVSEWPTDEQFWFPVAGVPWFITLFGRDALVTSLQTLPLSYQFAEGSLRALAALQASGTDDDRDMEPGKIEHEVRRGELARLRLIPHTPYYGSHDTTPLYVLTAASAWRWHGDRGELNRLRPHVEAALSWIDSYGDLDGDGLQEYRTRSTRGYFNQGWKDAHDAILHSDGSLPELPIATCELQGLVVAAKRSWADVLDDAYGDSGSARRLRAEADRLAAAIEEQFFWEAEDTYYLGLDGRKRPIESVASNPGQLLYYGAIDPDRARRVTSRLFAEDLWSGWGIRTLSAFHPSYNPFSYQLGFVWPHDNALIAAGFRRYGFDAEAQVIARALFDAAECLQNRCLPELFSGLQRDEASFPVQYLEANVPQAWAAGAVIQLVGVLLGLDADVSKGKLFLHPALPEWMEEVTIEGLAAGNGRCSFSVRRDGSGKHEVDIKSADNAMAIVLG